MRLPVGLQRADVTPVGPVVPPFVGVAGAGLRPRKDVGGEVVGEDARALVDQFGDDVPTEVVAGE